jgi:hypothetical protein
VLVLGEDVVGAGVAGVIEQVVRVEPGHAEADLDEPWPDLVARRSDGDRAGAAVLAAGHKVVAWHRRSDLGIGRAPAPMPMP